MPWHRGRVGEICRNLNLATNTAAKSVLRTDDRRLFVIAAVVMGGNSEIP